MNEELKKKIQKELLDPIKDPRRVMKMEYLFSHKYILIAVIIAVDLLYIDKNGGLIQMNGSTPPPQYAENSLDKKDMKMIDITETVDYSRDGLTDEAEEILSKRLEYASDER